MINKKQQYMTRLTSAKKAYEIKRILEKENRFKWIAKYREKNGTIAFYIFYYVYR